MKNIIVAYDNERAIGANGDLLWGKGELKADMKQFRERTMGHVMIMGRKTLDSIGIELPGRKTIVCSRNNTCEIPNIETARSLDEAYSLAEEYDSEIFIVGGGEIYKQALKDVERIYATEVDTAIPGADTYFPELDRKWYRAHSQQFPADEDNKYPYSFVTYERT
ncbi:MAG: dihydrofolate reductase [Candidatus Saccharibacteria bacterium]